MQFSVETLGKLNRKLSVSVPSEQMESEVTALLRKKAPTLKVDGFRKGKVPEAVLRRMYAPAIRQEVAESLIQSTYPQALKEAKLSPASYPTIDNIKIAANEDFSYEATFEILPDVVFNELNPETHSVEQIDATVTDNDVETVLSELQKQHVNWVLTERASATGDKVTIDFVGKLDGVPFEGGTANSVEVELGAGKMIPSFEEGLIGKTAPSTFEMSVTFPVDYQSTELAGKNTTFDVTLHSVMAPELPALDDAFAAKFDVKEGGIPALKAKLKESMQSQLKRQLDSINRESLFEAFSAFNLIDVPVALVEEEIGHLKHELYHKIFGHEHKENEKIPDFPRDMFEEKAIKRVRLGLLLSAYAKHHKLKPTEADINATIESIGSFYEDMNELKAWYREDKKRLAEIESLAVEALVAKKIAEGATLTTKVFSYEEIRNEAYKKDKEDKTLIGDE